MVEEKRQGETMRSPAEVRARLERTTKEKLLADGKSLTLEEVCVAVYLHGWSNGYRKASGKKPSIKLLDEVVNHKSRQISRILKERVLGGGGGG